MQKVSKYKTATAYAQAWFGAAKDRKEEERVLEEARAIRDSFNDNAALWSMLSAPTDDGEAAEEIIASLAKKLKLSQISTELLKLMAANRRLKFAGLAAADFIRFYYQDKGITEVTADTAVALTAAQDKRLKKILEEKLNTPVEITYRITPSVIGGLALRFNSFLIDDTVAGKLKRIKQQMLQQTGQNKQ